MSTYTLHKGQRLKSEIQIRTLFASGKSFVAYPLRVVFANTEQPEVKIMASVPKRLFKRAVKRNLLKRRIREAYRLQQTAFNPLDQQHGLHISFAYIAPEILPYSTLEHAMTKAAKKINTINTPTPSEPHEDK